jgi:hypothetical protein
MRACTPLDPSTSYSTIEPPAPPVPPAPHDPTPTLAASLDQARDQGRSLRATLASLADDLDKKGQQCKPVQAGSDLPAERWEKGDISVLKGCWQLGRDVSMTHRFADGRTEKVVARAGRLCFDDSGSGLHEQVTVGPGETWDCKAPISAKFWSNGTLVTNQPDVMCEGSPPTRWAATRLACRRVDDSLALCQATDRTGHTQLEFRRAP